MKRILVFAFVGLLALCSCRTTEVTFVHKPTQEETMSIQKTYDFIKAVGHYFIATADGDQPRVRPFGTIHIFEGKLYIQTGRSKKVAKQLLANGKAEICALKENTWIRVSGELVDDQRKEAKNSLLEEYPSLKQLGYSPDDPNTMVLYFKPGTVTATIYSFTAPPEEMHF